MRRHSHSREVLFGGVARLAQMQDNPQLAVVLPTDPDLASIKTRYDLFNDARKLMDRMRDTLIVNERWVSQRLSPRIQGHLTFSDGQDFPLAHES